MPLLEKKYDAWWPASRQSKKFIKQTNKYRHKAGDLSRAELMRVSVALIMETVLPSDLKAILDERGHKYFKYHK
jgi:hypothetical protein